MLLDTLLVERSKALMSKMGDMLHDDKLPPGQVKLVSQMLEVLQNAFLTCLSYIGVRWLLEVLHYAFLICFLELRLY